MYKEGETVLLYSWDELVDIYGFCNDSNTCVDIQNGWLKNWHRDVLKNRIVKLGGEYEKDKWIVNNLSIAWIYSEIIKCHMGEYYLQKIKEELDTE